jgi:hypothetical protein
MKYDVKSLKIFYSFFLGFIPPFLGAVGSIVTALMAHNDEIRQANEIEKYKI